MFDQLNLYLQACTSPERRETLITAMRTLESLLGPQVWTNIDHLLTVEEAADTNYTMGEIEETILGLFYSAYAQFGIVLDIDQLEPRLTGVLTETIEALLQSETSEFGQRFRDILEVNNNVQDALLEILDEVLPHCARGLEDVIYQVSPSLLERLLEATEARLELRATEVATEAEAAYQRRVQAFRAKHGRTPVVGALLDSGANLRFGPNVTISLIESYLGDLAPKEAALELYALVTYSNLSDADVLPATRLLVKEAFASEEQAGEVELVLNEVLVS